MRALLIAAALLTAGPAWAATLPPALAKVQHDDDQAQMTSDRAELERPLAPDYLLHNSSGQMQDKASFMAGSTAPGFHLNPFTIDEPIERVIGDMALLGGVGTLSGTDGGKPFTVRLRFMDVWQQRAGRWRVIFTQAARVPAAS